MSEIKSEKPSITRDGFSKDNYINKRKYSRKIIFQYGLLQGALFVIIGVIKYVSDQYLQPSSIYIFIEFLISIAVISLGINAFKNANRGYLSFGEAIKMGIGIVLIGGIIAAIWIFLLRTIIEPNYATLELNFQRQKLQSNPNITDSQIDTIVAASSKVKPWMYATGEIIKELFLGFIISLIAGLIMKNQNPYERQA